MSKTVNKRFCANCEHVMYEDDGKIVSACCFLSHEDGTMRTIKQTYYILYNNKDPDYILDKLKHMCEEMEAPDWCPFNYKKGDKEMKEAYLTTEEVALILLGLNKMVADIDKKPIKTSDDKKELKDLNNLIDELHNLRDF